MSRPKYYTHNGKTLTMREWSLLSGLDTMVIKMRLHNGWSFQKAISTPNLRYRYELDGMLLSLNDLAEMAPHLTKDGLEARLKRMSVKDAISLPRLKTRSMNSPCGIPCFQCPYDDCHKDK